MDEWMYKIWMAAVLFSRLGRKMRTILQFNQSYILNNVPSILISQEHGVISFEFDSGGPSRIEAWLPAVSAGSGVAAIWQPDSELTGMEAHIEEKQLDRMVYLQNKAPKWDEAHGGHVLNFQVNDF